MEGKRKKKREGCLRLNIETKLSAVIDMPKAGV